MIEQWLSVLEQLELLRLDDTEHDDSDQSVLSDEDIADTLWLAVQIGGDISTAATVSEERDNDETTESDTARNATVTLPPAVTPPPTIPAYPENAQTQGSEIREDLPDTGLPLGIQTAPALQNARGIGRALRPLMRKASSRVVQVFDEPATVDRIAEEEIWLPVLKPARERWFDLELVVEKGPLSFVWEASLAELQQVLERQGAFRHIRTWQVSVSKIGEPQLRSVPIRSPMKRYDTTTETQARSQTAPLRSHKELIDASSRGLVMYVSDCRSELWRSGNIHKWLKLWGEHGPVTLVQLLPERLWQQTALKAGFRVQVSAFARGVANTKLRKFNVPLRYRETASSMLTLPAITLTEAAIAQWAQVVMAVGQQRLPARLFDTVWVENARQRQDEEWAVIEPETPEDRLELFEATTSAPAQRLARLMSVVPVELPVVHIIQRAFFKDKASPIHVAEVYNSCLIKQLKGADTERPKYDFETGVRSLLNKQTLIDESFDVLDVVSQEIARSLGFEITSFTALLLPNIADSEQAQAAILPFAKIATDVLYRLGGHYAQLAEQVDSEVVARNRPAAPVVTVEPEDDFEIPPLKDLEFFRTEIRGEIPPVQLVMDEFMVAMVEFQTVQTELLDVEDDSTLGEETETTDKTPSTSFIAVVTEQLMQEEQLRNLSVDSEFYFLGYRETPTAIDFVAFVEADELTERQVVDLRDQFFRAVQTISYDSDVRPLARNPNGLLAFIFENASSEAMAKFISKQARSDSFGKSAIVVCWAIDVSQKKIYTHQNPVSLMPPVYILEQKVFPGFNFLQDTLEQYVKIDRERIVRTRLSVFEFEVASLVRRFNGSPSSITSRITRFTGNDWIASKGRKTAYKFIELLGDATELEMVAIPAGTFMMGSPESEPERDDDEGPQHEVEVEAFYMGRYPITQAQWRFVAALEQVNIALAANPSSFKGDDRPVERVSWHEAIEFCDRLSRHTGNDYKLPSEAQWEYACRAGTQSPFYFGDTISSEIANYDGTTVYSGGPQGESRHETTPVDHFNAANAFGLSDMHGNVWEWCADHWHSNYEGAPGDGSAWITKNEDAQRVRRGGSWSDNPRFAVLPFATTMGPMTARLFRFSSLLSCPEDSSASCRLALLLLLPSCSLYFLSRAAARIIFSKRAT